MKVKLRSVKKNETITSKINIYDELKNLSEDKKIKKEKEFNERVETIKTTYETTFNEDSKFKSKFDERVKNIKIKVTKKTDPLYSDSITEHLLRDLQELNDEFKTNEGKLLDNRNLITMANLINDKINEKKTRKSLFLKLQIKRSKRQKI